MDTIKRILSMLLVFAVVIAGTVAMGTQQVSAATGEQIVSSKTVTKVTTKTSNKSVKMSSKAKASKVSAKTTTKKTTTTKKSAEKKIVVLKTVKTVVKTTFTKGSKIKKIKTTVTTTTKTTTTIYKAAEKLSAEEAEMVNSIVKAVPADVMQAFTELGFTVKINPQLATAGNFSTCKHCIQLKSANTGHLLHEMGHFLSCLKDKADETAEFAAIYEKEKNVYAGSNKAYIISTDDEYFAESYRDYVEQPAQLKKNRPLTYTYINELATSITQEDIERTRKTYGL